MSTPAKNFFAGLAGGFGQSMLQQHQKQQQEDLRAKQQDYELLMMAYKQMQPDLTPSQTQMLMEKAVDIWQPKGSKPLKEKLKELFGGGEDYQPQSGRILGEVGAMPRRMVQGEGTETVALPPVPIEGMAADDMPSIPEALRTGFTPAAASMEMPKPPMPEMTYRERELSDDITRDVSKQTAMQQRQLALEKEKAKERLSLESTRFQNRLKALDTTARNREMLQLNRRTRQIATNPDAPTVEERAEAQRQLNEENDLKQQQIAARIDALESNEQYKQSLIDQGWARIQTSIAVLQDNRRRTWADSQYKRLRTDVETYNRDISRLLQQAKNDPANAEKYQSELQQKVIDRDAKVLELDQKLGAEGEQFFPYQSPQGVPLPRGGTAPKRSTKARLTRQEILDAGGTKADIDEARSKGYLVE